MLYVSSIDTTNGYVSITDTDDNVTQRISASVMGQVVKKLKASGVVIAGVEGGKVKVVTPDIKPTVSVKITPDMLSSILSFEGSVEKYVEMCIGRVLQMALANTPVHLQFSAGSHCYFLTTKEGCASYPYERVGVYYSVSVSTQSIIVGVRVAKLHSNRGEWTYPSDIRKLVSDDILLSDKQLVPVGTPNSLALHGKYGVLRSAVDIELCEILSEVYKFFVCNLPSVTAKIAEVEATDNVLSHIADFVPCDRGLATKRKLEELSKKYKDCCVSAGQFKNVSDYDQVTPVFTPSRETVRDLWESSRRWVSRWLYKYLELNGRLYLWFVVDITD